MPDRWTDLTLGDVCTLTKGTSPTERTPPGPYPLVVTAERWRTSAEYQFDGEAVCIPTISSTGHGDASLKRVHFASGKFALANLLVAAQVTRPDLLSTRYLYLYLSAFKDQLIVPLMTGTANVTLKPRDLLHLPLRLPPLVVQRRVVDLVDAVDTYATAAAARAAAAQAIRSALLAELLVGGDGWVATDLGSVAEWFSGGTPKAGTREFYEEGTVPWVVIGDLNDGPITSTATKITEAGLAEIGGRTAPPGSVLVSMYGTIGRLGIAETDLATNQAIAWGVVSDSVLPEYLFLWLSFTQPELDAKARGATQRNINRRIIRDHHILVPALAEQQRIVDLAGAAEDEADRAAEAEEAALSLRSALLDELLAGGREIAGSYDELVGLVA